MLEFLLSNIKYKVVMGRNMSTQYNILGFSVPQIAMINGLILVIWGLIAYFLQTSENPSITAMIPAFFGIILFVLGLLSIWNEENRHHYMHASMALALVMILGGLRVFPIDNEMSNLEISSHLILIISGVFFIIVGIKSFRFARLTVDTVLD